MISHLRPASEMGIKPPRAVASAARAAENPDRPRNTIGINYQRDRAITYSAVARAITLIATGISSMPVNVCTPRTHKSGSYVLRDDPLYSLVSAHSLVNGVDTFQKVLTTALSDALLTGNGYIEIIRDMSGAPAGLAPLEPSRISVEHSAEVGYTYVWHGGSVHRGRDEPRTTWTPTDLIHIRMPQLTSRATPTLNRDQSRYVDSIVKGTSPLVSLSNIIDIGISSEEFVRDFFRSGMGATLGVILGEGATEQDISGFQEFLNSQANAAAKHLPIVIKGGGDIKSIQHDAQNEALASLRSFNVRAVADVYGIPAHLLGENEGTTAWGTGIESLGRGFYRFSLHPMASQVEAELSAKLGNGKVIFRLDHDHITRESPSERLQNTLKSLGSPNSVALVSLEEGRRMNDLPPIDPNDTWAEFDNVRGGEEEATDPKPVDGE